MGWFPFPIFPEGALSASVIVTVWVGITVVALTNLRLGWVLSGLVIPGYMVPLLIVKPAAAAVVFVEGVVTYSLVWLYSEYSTRFTGTSNFFGRDRFLALVLVSVAVRIANDGFLLPALGAWLLQNYDYAFDYRSNLHSFGLIIVALIANNFWKSGVLRGAWPMAVQVGITWVIVRYVLMEFTNFNMASLAFMYEDSASSFLAAPKAYIVLLVTAFIASRLNLFYGWDFSGILIPSLLALQWYEPSKIVATFVEAVVILVFADVVLRAPVFRNITMEGARKLLLFFNVSFVYKYLLSWGMILFMPQMKVSDWFGFGYLLATLIALKIHDKGIFARMTRATLQASFTGVAVATVIGFLLVVLPEPDWEEPVANRAVPLGPMVRDMRDITAVLDAGKTNYYATSFGQSMAVPLQREIDAFSAGVRKLMEYRHSTNPEALERARHALLAANYDIERISDQYLLLRERQPAHHWGTYVLRLDGESQLLVAVPAPIDEVGSFEAGAALFTRFSARAFAAAAASRFANEDGSSDVLTRPQTIFQAFHRELALREVLQVRSRNSTPSVLHVSGNVPEGIDLKDLENAMTSLKIEFTPSAQRNLQRQTMSGNFSEIWMDRSDANRIRLAGRENRPVVREPINQSVASLLRQLVTPQQVAAPESNAYRPPRQEELLRIDREVLSPLLALASTLDSRMAPDQNALATFSSAAASSLALGIELRWITEVQGNAHRDYFLISDRGRHGGWIVIRAGVAENIVLEVPRPVSETGTLETAINAFGDLRVRALVVAGATPDANKDGSADVLAMNNAKSLFTLTHQIALREMGEQSGVAAQVRAFGIRPDQPPPRDDALLTFDTGVIDRGDLSGAAAALLNGLEKAGLSIRLGGGAIDTAGYEAASGAQASYMSQTRNKHFAVLWVSPLARRHLNEESLMAERSQFTALGLPVTQGAAIAELSKRRTGDRRLPSELRTSAEQYLATKDVVLLAAMRRRYPELRFERLEDSEGRGAFLLIGESDRVLLGAMSLATRSGRNGTELAVASGPLAAEAAARFVTGRIRWLVVK